MYLVVNIGGIDVTADYQINKPSANPNSLPICAIKMDTGVSHEFPSVCFFFFYTKKRNYYKSSRVFKSYIFFS